MPNQNYKPPDDFFYALRSYWDPIPPTIQNSFLQQTSQLMKLEAKLSADPDLMTYDQEIYPEIGYMFRGQDKEDEARSRHEAQLPNIQQDLGEQCADTEDRTIQRTDGRPNRQNAGRPATEQRAALHFCNLQIQLMENVFYDLRLAQYYAHSTARGWMNLFQRWASTETFRLLWPSLRSTYSKDFVEFAEYQLNLSPEINPEVYSRKDGTWPHDLDLIFEKLKSHLTGKNDSTVPEKPPKILRELLREWPVQEYKYDLYYKPFMNPLIVARVGDTHPSTNHSHLGEGTWGFGVLAKDPEAPSRLRLMVWIRPAFRRLGLGSQILQKLCVSYPVENKQVVVLLPALRCDDPGYSYEMAGWLRFYGRKGFVRTCLNDARSDLNASLDQDSFCLMLNVNGSVRPFEEAAQTGLQEASSFQHGVV
ncbi:GNAT family N-acetyltransferase [Nitrospira sp. Nam80]